MSIFLACLSLFPVSLLIQGRAAHAMILPCAARRQKSDQDAWKESLRETLALEKRMLAQLSYDSSAFGALWPYLSAIEKGREQIQRLEELLTVEPEAGEVPSIRVHQLLGDAYETALEYERELVRRYEWLVDNSSDIRTRKVLSENLFYARMYESRFGLAAGKIAGFM